VRKLEAQFDFDARHRQAFRHEVRAVLTGRARTLLSFDEAIRVAKREAHVDKRLQEIPLAQIKGSEGRARDFDASFLPRNPSLRERWTRLETLMLGGVDLPPIEVYKLDELYFVRDGHHGVCVARSLGYETTRANVIEVRTRVPLPQGIDPRDLLCTAEYADFLELTQLDRLRPAARLECRELGHYDVIYEHILGHRYFMGLERGHEVSLEEAVADWFDSVYEPIMQVVRKHGLSERFRDSGLYLAITRRWLELSRDGQPRDANRAGDSLIEQPSDDEHMSALSGLVRRWIRHRVKRMILLRPPSVHRRLTRRRSLKGSQSMPQPPPHDST
jgi:hypothetical protein